MRPNGHSCYAAFLPFFTKDASIEPLVDADLALELKSNTHLKDSVEKQAQFRREYISTVLERLRILRRNLFRSFLLLATATVLALRTYLRPRRLALDCLESGIRGRERDRLADLPCTTLRD
jgi:hypothetical protein